MNWDSIKYLLKRFVYIIYNPRKTFYNYIKNHPEKVKNDELYIRALWYYHMPFELNLRHPKRYNEKLQWLKLHDRNPMYTKMVDKYEAKQYVAGIIGERYIIPTIGVWDSVDDIDWASLPDQFVLKCTHDSGGLVICKDKKSLNIEDVKKKIQRSLEKDYYILGREWPYKNVPRRIIAEKYMEDTRTKELRDYKFFCFDGKVKALFIASERMTAGEETKFDFFNENFQHLPILNGHPNASVQPEKPHGFEEMKMLASKLSNNIPHVRVDFYEVDENIYFGELTFFHWSGFIPFKPDEWDFIFGSWIKLPIDKY